VQGDVLADRMQVTPNALDRVLEIQGAATAQFKQPVNCAGGLPHEI